MTSVPSYHMRGTHLDRDGEDGTAMDGHVNFNVVNHHRRSYSDVAANVKDTAGPDGINDDIHYRDSPTPGVVEDESAAMRLSNLRSGRKHGAFRAWESHDGTTPHHHYPHHRHLNPPLPPLTNSVYPPDQPVPNASVIRVTKENVHHSNPSTSSHLPYTSRSNKHNSKKRSSSHFGPEQRSIKRSPSPEPSTSGSTSGSQSNYHEHIYKQHHHIKSNKHAHNKYSKSSSHSVPHLDRIAKEPTSVSAAAYHPEVPYVDSDDNVETSDSDVDVMNSPPPGECCYTPTEELWRSAPPALPPSGPPPPPPAHSGAHHHNHYGGGYARPRSAQLSVRPKHASSRDSYTTYGATDRSCRFHQRPAEDVNLDRNAMQRQYADPYDQHLLSGAYGAMAAAQQLTNAAERELFASGGFPSATAVNLSTKETNSDDSDIEVVSIIETKKPRLRSSKRGRSVTVVVDLTESDTEAGPSATQSRPGDSVADGDPVIEYVNHADEEDSQDAVQINPPDRPDPPLDTEAGPSATQSRPADDDVYVSLPEVEPRVGSTSQANMSQSRSESRPPFHHLPPPPPSYSETMYQGYSSSRHYPVQRSSCHAQKDTFCSHSFGRPTERGDKHLQEGYDRHAHSSRHHPHSQRSYRRSSEYSMQLFF